MQHIQWFAGFAINHVHFLAVSKHFAEAGMQSLNFLFIIQGEGRGHLTQALALKSILDEAGHEVSEVLIGRSSRRRIPAFFLKKIDAKVTFFESPNFAVDGKQESIRIWPTFIDNLKKSTGFRGSLELMRARIEGSRPDVIVNFFEPLAGIYNLFYKKMAPMICIGHQYMFHHPAYSFPPGKWSQRLGTKHFTRLTAFGAARKLALSLYPAEDRPRLSVMPPLLRPELFELSTHETEPFYLIYLLNQGYARAVIAWHEAHPTVPLHCFWDNEQAPEELIHDSTLTFHQLSDVKFLDKMARCQGLVCTAGFESTCEAMYLGKSILAVPVKGHVEQYWNALDLERFGGGISSTSFQIDRLFNAAPIAPAFTQSFREWVDTAPVRYIQAIEETVEKETRRKASI